MKTYAYVNGGAVCEIIRPCAYDAEAPEWQDGEPSRIGQEIPIELRFVPEMVRNMVDLTDIDPQPEYGWTFNGKDFSAPVPYQPSPQEILLENTGQRDAFLSQATLSIAPLQYAVDFGEATADEEARLTAWKKYMIAVNRVDLTAPSPTWPPAP